MTRVVTDEERKIIDGHRLRRWLTSRDYRAKQDLYFLLLTTLTGLVVDREGKADPRVLADLLAITIEGDATFRGWVKKKSRNSTRLKTASGWHEVALCAAALVVERYERSTKDQPEQLPDEFALTREELVQRVGEVIDLVGKKAAEAEDLGRQQPKAESYTPPANVRPDLAAEMERRLLTTLESEMLIVAPTGDELGIPEAERDREVAKRALVRLRIGELRNLAREEGIPETGAFEQVAQRIAEKHGDDEAEIAELVLRHEEDTPERGYVSRLVGLIDGPNISQAATRLNRLNTQYIRVGVARWFICTGVKATETRIRVVGLFRYYHVRPKMEYDEYSIAADPQQADVEIVLRQGVRWIEISSRVVGDIRALSLALGQTAGVRPREYLPIALKVSPGDIYSYSLRTVFMLMLVGGDLMDEHVQLLNMKLAHFESDAKEGSDDPRRPSVRSVRLGGQHLLSSRQACELIVAGRALLSFTGTVAVSLSASDRVVCPIRIELAEDHATVFTGFTSREPHEELTRHVHELLVERVRAALERAEMPGYVLALVPKIRERARGENPAVADILPPPVNAGAEPGAKDASETDPDDQP